MSEPTSTKHRRRLIISLTAVGLILAAATALGIYGLTTGPNSGTTATKTHAGSSSAPPTAETIAPTRFKALAHTTDPRVYARQVAEALFRWDTMSGHTPNEYAGVLLDDADPSETETSGLVKDITMYLPDPAVWRQLQTYETRQTLTIDTIVVPDQWAVAVADAHGRIAHGTTAYTVTGARHRSGIWFGKPVTSVHVVSFTVFIACPPAFDRCHLLRLSELDNPLR